MLTLNNIHKSFADGNQVREVLRGVTLHLEKGDFVAITGVSGSGKTTLLSILGTILRPDNGEYILSGRNLTLPGISLQEVRNKEIGFVFQDFRLLPQLNVRENILLPLLASHSTVPAEGERRADELMQFTGIAHLAQQMPATLSGGEKARASICRALINTPSLLLADEPTGQLDAETSATIARLFQQINQQMHTTIVMVTHSGEMASVAHRTYRLSNGKI